MAKLSPPDRGQPLDLSYIRQIVSAINDLSNELSPEVANSTSIDTISGSTIDKKTVRTANSRIVGGYKTVSYDSSKTPNSEVPFEYRYSDFKLPPIVTVTPLLEPNATLASKDITVVLTTVATDHVAGIVRFNSQGVATVGMNIIAVGIPKSGQ